MNGQRVAGDGGDCATDTFGRRERSSSGESGAGRHGKREKAIQVVLLERRGSANC
jgi:hypothetical protein